MPILYSFSIHPTFQGGRQYCACAKRVRSQKQPQRRVKHTKRLVQKKFSQEACKRDLGDRIRHESSESRQSDSTNPVRRRTTEDTRDAFARLFLSRPLPVASDAELALEQLIDRLRIGLAAGCLHDLT